MTAAAFVQRICSSFVAHRRHAVATLIKNPPLLGDEELRFSRRQIEHVADVTGFEIHAVNVLREFASQSNAHAPASATLVPAFSTYLATMWVEHASN